MPPQTQQIKQKTLVVVNSYGFDVDKLIAAICLSKLLATQPEVKVDLLISNWTSKTPLSDLALPTGINVIGINNNNYTQVTIPKQGGAVKEVRWQQSGDDLVLMVQYENGQLLPEKMIVNKDATYYDQLYVVGSKDKNAAELMLGDKKDLLNTTIVNTLSVHPPKTSYAQNHYVYSASNSYCAALLAHAKILNLNILPSIATELLKGVSYNTRFFADNNNGTSAVVSELLLLGADLAEANYKLLTSGNNDLLNLQNNILNKVVIQDSIGFCELSDSQSKLVKDLESLNPLKNPLSENKDLTASFVLMPIEGNKTLVWTSNKKEVYDFANLFKNFKWNGTHLHGQMVIFTTLPEALTTIKKYLNTVKLTTSKAVSTDPIVVKSEQDSSFNQGQITSFKPASLNNLNEMLSPQGT